MEMRLESSGTVCRCETAIPVVSSCRSNLAQLRTILFRSESGDIGSHAAGHISVDHCRRPENPISAPSRDQSVRLPSHVYLASSGWARISGAQELKGLHISYKATSQIQSYLAQWNLLSVHPNEVFSLRCQRFANNHARPSRSPLSMGLCARQRSMNGMHATRLTTLSFSISRTTGRSRP